MYKKGYSVDGERMRNRARSRGFVCVGETHTELQCG